MTLQIEDVFFRYGAGDPDVLAGVSMSVRPGELVAVAGPNGSGKTTLLRIALGRIHPGRGTAMIDGREVRLWAPRALARIAAVLPQTEQLSFPLRARDAVMFGRYPYLSPWGDERDVDRDVVREALARCDAQALEARWVHTLSGGEWQRVRIARALAQQPRLLVLDEPTSSLDVRHAMEVFELVSSLAHAEQMAVIVVTHEINLAARFADRILVLADGQPLAQGRPEDVLQADLLEEAFGWPVEIISVHGVPQFFPLRQGE